MKYLLLILLIFFIFSLLLPVYDKVNGFHNLFLDDYKLVWADGRSPANFYILQNIAKNKSISFPQDYIINGIRMDQNFDFLKVDDAYKPWFDVAPLVPFIFIFYLTNNQLILFKLLLLLNILFYTGTLIFFYFCQKILGLKRSWAYISTLIAGIATGILIYSRYLFLQATVPTFLFFLFLYVVLKKFKHDFLISFIFFVFILSISLLWLEGIIILSIFFLLLLYKYKKINNPSIFIIFVILALIISSIYIFGVLKITKKFDSIFNIFPNYVPAQDYSIYGYSDENLVERHYSYIYGFQQGKGNAIFLFLYAIFGAMFGPKGFVFNSPFLIFSIFGMTLHKMKMKNFIILTILLFLFVYCFTFIWHGGFTPRYVNHFDIPILLLTFFSFYYLQESKNKIIRLLFIVLIILSVLNVSSLSVRTDWNYEHEADLVSYDLVLWPWYPPIWTTSNETKILLTSTEISKWKLGGENDCKATFGGEGLITDPCDCKYDSWVEREIKLDKDAKTVEIIACADIAGNDGTKGFFYVDNKLIGDIFIESNSCNSKKISVNISSGIHTIKFKSGIYGQCYGEMIFWKSINFEEI